MMSMIEATPHPLKNLRAGRLATILLLALGTVAGCSSGRPTQREGYPYITHTALITTTMGEIEVDLYGKDAPKTVANFVGLAKKSFYDGILFHRVIPDFVLQAGDPKSKNEKLKAQWGTGGESIYGSTFADELDKNSPSGKRGYEEGTLAMANRGPNTNTSQFFIIVSQAGADRLSYNYTIFGKVTRGMDVVHAIESVQTGANDQPVIPVSIMSMKAREY